MFNLLRSEWIKVTRNRVLLSFLIWLIPVGQAAFLAIAIIISVFSKEAGVPFVSMSSHLWTKDMIEIWKFITEFPINIFGRFFFLAFMAVVFAGEYEWDTWKNIIPRSQRVRLILVKYIVLTALVILSLLTTGLISSGGFAITHKIIKMEYGPNLSGDVVIEFLSSFGQEFLLGTMSILILVGFAGLSAMLTRSILGGLLASLGLSVLEPMTLGILTFLRSILNSARIINLYMVTPSFHVDNARSWFQKGIPLTNSYMPSGIEINLALSLIVLSTWVLGLAGLVIFLFRRQDIT